MCSDSRRPTALLPHAARLPFDSCAAHTRIWHGCWLKAPGRKPQGARANWQLQMAGQVDDRQFPRTVHADVRNVAWANFMLWSCSSFLS